MFDARSAKLLEPGQHLTSPDYPGLRLDAYTDRRTWTYRYRSPIDNRLRQVKIGNWPAMSVHAAVVEWEKLRALRDTGADPAEQRRQSRQAQQLELAEQKASAARRAYTVLDVCTDYWSGHVRHARVKKGATEVWRMFDTMLGDVANGFFQVGQHPGKLVVITASQQVLGDVAIHAMSKPKRFLM